MVALSELVSSLRGELVARNREPLLGTFILSWGACNWNKLAVLVWGENTPEERIADLANSLSVTNFFSDLQLIILPLLVSIFFLFGLPRLSLLVRRLQLEAALRQHTHSVEFDCKKAVEQRKLRKVALRADPEKEFLAEEVRLELLAERERLERRNKVKFYIEQKADAAAAATVIAKAEAEKKLLEQKAAASDLERREAQNALEAARFAKTAAFQHEMIASARFPLLYSLMEELSTRLRDESIWMTQSGLSAVFAAVFGYEDAEEMMRDAAFSIEEFTQVKYIFLKMGSLVKRLDQISAEEVDDPEMLMVEQLLDHLMNIFEKFDVQLLSEEALAEDISIRVNEDRYSLLHSKELSGPIAETDTVFDEIELELVGYSLQEQFFTSMQGVAQGQHRGDPGVQGQSLAVVVETASEPIIGKYGLSDYEMSVTARPII